MQKKLLVRAGYHAAGARTHGSLLFDSLAGAVPIDYRREDRKNKVV
jgi:hypothetical protein